MKQFNVVKYRAPGYFAMNMSQVVRADALDRPSDLERAININRPELLDNVSYLRTGKSDRVYVATYDGEPLVLYVQDLGEADK